MYKYTLEIKLDEELITSSEENTPIIEYYNSLMNKNTLDSGIDLPLLEDHIIKSSYDNSNVETFNFGIKCQMKEYNEFVPYYLYPRSSISKTPLSMANSVGIIDSSYRGYIMAKVRNTSKDDYNVEKGTRLFQICSRDLSPFEVKIVQELSTTARGEGGFGSTGININTN